MYRFSTRSRNNLATCAAALRRLFIDVIRYEDCSILCGHRGREEQENALLRGTSLVPWPRSMHNRFPSRAVDVAPYPIDWKDVERFRNFSIFVKSRAAALGIPIEWGGDWTAFRDYPHWQLLDE